MQIVYMYMYMYKCMCVQEGFHFPRSQPPHGSCFLGHPFILHISPDQPKTEFDLECHSNESILSVKQKIAKKLDVSPEQVQIGLSERWLDTSDNNKLIYQMGFSDRQLIIVKTHTIVSSYSSKVSEVGLGVTDAVDLYLTPDLLHRLKKEMLNGKPWLRSRKGVFLELSWLVEGSYLTNLSSCVL